MQSLSGSNSDSKDPPKLPIVHASEAKMKKSEAREGMELKLDKPAVCRVSFSQGNEKTVLFAVHGIPQVGFAGSQHTCHVSK